MITHHSSTTAQSRPLRFIVVAKDQMLALTGLEDTDLLVFHLLDDSSALKLGGCNNYLWKISYEQFWRTKLICLLRGPVLAENYKKTYFEIKKIDSLDDRLIYAIRNSYDDMVKLLLGQCAALEREPHKDQPLSVAAVNGRVSIAMILLGAGADIHNCNEDALREAIKGGSVQMVDFLLDRGAIVTYSVIHTATIVGSTTILDRLVDCYDYDFPPGLMGDACEANKLSSLEWMERRGIDIKSGGHHGLTIAASRGHLSILEWLIDRGVDLFRWGDEAFLLAARRGQTAAIDLLKSYGLNDPSLINQAIVAAAETDQLNVLTHLWTEGDDLIPPIVAAIKSGSFKVMRHLLEKARYKDHVLTVAINTAVRTGVPIYVEIIIKYINRAVDCVKVDQFSLETAIKGLYVKILRLLADKGVLTAEEITNSLLMHAIDSGNTDTISFLLELETDSQRVYPSDDVMRYAMRTASREIIKLFVDYGSYYRHADLLMMAVTEVSPEGVELMIENGAVNRYTGTEALHIAIENGDSIIVKLLLDAGIKVDREAYRVARRTNNRSIYRLLKDEAPFDDSDSEDE